MDTKDKRTEQLKIMLTPEEMAELVDRADTRSLPKSTLARSVLLTNLGEA